jgi:Fe-S cluster biogenesis protein NfuA/nitrite reductase/ring-hydroxylating ferredoxin subunit
VRGIVALYGEGLERIPALLADEGAAGSAIWRRLAGEERVAGLLALHGLHPEPLAERVERGLEKVRPYLGSHGGDVHLVAVDERTGEVRLRLDGTCDGCPASSATLELAVAGAIRAEAPEVGEIRVEGVEVAATSTLLQIQSDAPASEWHELVSPFTRGDTGVRSQDLGAQRILVCQLGDDAFAYREGCAGCGAPLAGGKLDGDELCCAACGERFDLRRAGRNLSGGASLAPLPLLASGNALRVALAKV